MIWTHGNHGVKTLALAIGVLLVGMISCGCLTVRGAPLADDLSDATKCDDDVTALQAAGDSLQDPIAQEDEEPESKCGLNLCPGRQCHSLVEEIINYPQRLGHELMCKIDPKASANFGGIPIMYRGPLESSNTDIAEITSFLLFKEWSKAFQATMLATSSTTKAWLAKAAIANITSIAQLDDLYNFFMNNYTIHPDPAGAIAGPQGAAGAAAKTSPSIISRLEASLLGASSSSSNPLPEGFWQRDNATDPFLSVNQRWNDDAVFAQARLMATNPVQIQRLTVAGSSTGMSWDKLEPLLNTDDFDWDSHIQSELGMNMSRAIQTHRLYVLDFPLLANITADPQATSAFAGRKMLAPIALFAATNNKSAPFISIAIQLGRNRSAPVYTPKSGYFWWSIAKMYVNSADGLVSQIAHHLVNAHLVSEAFAAATCHELVNSHPIHALLAPHFQGLIGINTEGFELLVSPQGFVTKIAGFGFQGMGELINLTYKHWSWEKTDFLTDLKTRGMYGGHEGNPKRCKDCQKLHYYPYRDDGLLLYRKMQSYVTEYINYYYCTDQDVLDDASLQRWAQFVATSHKNKGFPSSITSKAVLTEVMLRIIWVNSVHHAILNFPVKEFGAYVPAIAYTLRMAPSDWANYTQEIANASPENNDIFLKIFPAFNVAVNQTMTASQLASLRLHGLFEDTGSFKSSFAKQLTARYRQDLVDTSNHSSVQSVISRRNEGRKRRGVLAYRYMQPKYMPNSIVI